MTEQGFSWTEDADAVLRNLYRIKTHEQIAAMLGTTRAAVRNRCWRLGLRKRAEFWTPEEEDRLRRWYEERRGKPVHIKQLAKDFGRQPSAVCRKAAEMGLTDMFRPDPEESREVFRRAAKRRSEMYPHPRNMLGKQHSEETREKIRASSLRLVEEGRHPGQLPRSQETLRRMSVAQSQRVTSGGNVYSRARRGRRADLGDMYFRSSWEANYARFLNFLKAQGIVREWAYEPDTFWFEKIRRGVRSYTPDFRVAESDGSLYYVEVKGWMDPKSATKLKRMKKYHPHVEVRVVDERAYREISRKLGGAIAGWESAA